MVRIVNNVRPTGAVVLRTLETNGGMISTGGSLVTRRKRMLLTATRRRRISFLFRTTITKTVPVVHPVGRYLTMGSVSRIINVIGNAAGCVLAGVARRKVSFSSTLRGTRRLKFTRTSPASSMRNLSTNHGMTVVTSVTFRSEMMFPGMFARKVAGVATGSVRCTGRFSDIVGLLNMTRGARDKVRMNICPVVVRGRRPLTSMESSFGTIFIRKSTTSSTVFCKHNTKRFPATDTIVKSIVSITEGVTCNYGKEVDYAYCGGLPMGSVKSIGGGFFVHVRMAGRPNILTTITRMFNGRGIDVAEIIRRRARPRRTRLIVMARDIGRGCVGRTLRRLLTLPDVLRIDDVVHRCWSRRKRG